jgi:tRNA-uridine 2-sulfurtransferase
MIDFPPIDLDLPKGARVVVAMSGGVDSSVTAALVQQAGYETIGVTLRLYDDANVSGGAPKRAGACCGGDDARDARAVADKLGIAHYVLDWASQFRANVIDDFVNEYAAGRTPIPCVRCNQRVKFADLLDSARDLGAAALATGHYARRTVEKDGVALRRGREIARDQSYFLFATTQSQLDFLRFPLGDWPKDKVREAAAAFGLPVASKPDSQDICFVPDGRYADLVKKLRPEAAKPGDIVHVDGRALGTHDGVIGFTVGQRRGLKIASDEPLYVVALDATARRVVVGPRTALERDQLVMREANWLALPDSAREIEVKLRSAQPPTAARVRMADLQTGCAEIELAMPVEGVAPGQACVVYDGDRVLGGGWIETTRALSREPDTGSRQEIAFL